MLSMYLWVAEALLGPDGDLKTTLSKGLSDEGSYEMKEEEDFTQPRKFLPRLHEFLEYVDETSDQSIDLFFTTNGLLGMMAVELVEGDLIALVRSSSPFIALRPSDGGYLFRGFVYVHGLMDQDVWDHVDFKDMETTTFTVM